MANAHSETRFVICVENTGYTASLEPATLTRVVPDASAEADGDLRVIDESGEDYLYPAEYFVQKDAASSVFSVMQSLMNEPPNIDSIRSDTENISEEQIFETLDTLQAAYRADHSIVNPYKNFRWNLTRGNRESRRRASPQLFSGPDRLSD